MNMVQLLMLVILQVEMELAQVVTMLQVSGNRGSGGGGGGAQDMWWWSNRGTMVETVKYNTDS
jgi:hypothetical protein